MYGNLTPSQAIIVPPDISGPSFPSLQRNSSRIRRVTTKMPDEMWRRDVSVDSHCEMMPADIHTHGPISWKGSKAVNLQNGFAAMFVFVRERCLDCACDARFMKSSRREVASAVSTWSFICTGARLPQVGLRYSTLDLRTDQAKSF